MSDFDPRFDPAFQPGYDPRKHGSRRSRAVPERQTQQQSDAFAPAPDAMPRVSEIAAAPVAAVESIAVPLLPAQEARRNPLLVALWVISALLVIAGVYGLRLIADRVSQLASNGNFGGSDYYLLQSYTIIAPLLIALGLATAIATLFLLAARRR